MDGQQRVPAVFRALQHGLELERLDPAGNLLRLPHQLRLHGRIGLRLEQLRHLDGALDPLAEIVVGSDPGLQGLDFLDGGAGRFGIGPEAGFGLPRFQRGQALGLGGKVKESLEVR
jgi:hypothetical protein